MRYILTGILLGIFHVVFAQHRAILNDDSTFNSVQQLKEVVVTAEKRELSPVDIPTALSVVTERTLPQENNIDLRNLSGIVPNFYMQEGGLKLSTPLYIRGIGTVSGTPPVGLYVDGVPVFDKNAFIFDLYDIKQIEILRGPQTTLYGRNSINGLINIRTNIPGNKFTLQAKAGVSSYNSQNYNLLLTLPVSNVLYSKLSASYNRSDGYFRNLYTGKKSNPQESWNFRYQGNVYANREWKIAFGLNYNNTYDGGYAYMPVDSLKEDRYHVNFNSPASYDRDLLSTYFNLKKEFRHTALNWVTSYSWAQDKQQLDADFTYWDVFSNNKKSEQNLVTQEINFQSVHAEHWDWTIGTFGFYKDLDNDYLALFGKDKAKLLPLDLDKAIYFNNTLTYGIAGYGQVTLKELLPGLSVTAGLRYDYENVELTYRDSVLFSGSHQYIGLHNTHESMNFKEWLPKFSVLQKWNDRLSFYVSVSKGYKAGGYNIISNEMSSQLVDLKYGKERLWNYETGMKYFSLNKKFNINASVYYIDWKDQQIFVMGMMGPNIKNAGDARSFGGEVDLRWEFLPGLAFMAAGGYTNSRYYHHIEKMYEDNRVVMAPDFTANASFSYQKAINFSLFRSLNASTSVVGMGTQYFDEANLLKQSPYFLWNMNVGVSGKYVDFSIWGKNILNKAFFCYMLNNPVGQNLPEYFNMGQSGAPSRFGASVTFKI